MGKKLVLYLLFTVAISAQEDLGRLLEIYKKESDLSNITKRESAGFLYLYTRNDLEKMQARTLVDVFKTVPALYVGRDTQGLIKLQRPTSLAMPITAMRLYINDHDMSSASLGSAFTIWGNIPIEYIDHIEIYKSTSSIEFGNETSIMVVRLYTKDAAREHGGKVRVSADNLLSHDTSAYYAQELDNGLSYFAYAQYADVKRTPYEKTFNAKTYEYKSDYAGYNLYANIAYKSFRAEIGSYKKSGDAFLGLGMNKTPDADASGMKTLQTYLHLTQKFSDGTKIALSFDDMTYSGTYVDENGIVVLNRSNPSVLNYAYIRYHDQIYSTVVEKEMRFGNSQMYVGAFYKHKHMYEEGEYRNDPLAYSYANEISNKQDVYSIYGEEHYNIDANTQLIASAKIDAYRYKKAVEDQTKFVIRIGAIKEYDAYQWKLFYSKTYIPVAMYQLYTPDNTPYIADTSLRCPDVDVLSLGMTYAANNHTATMRIAGNVIRNFVVFNPQRFAFENSDKTIRYAQIELRYAYDFDYRNKIEIVAFGGKNEENEAYSPRYGANIRLFNTFGRFDLYNELVYRASYTSHLGNRIDASYDYTVAAMYRYFKDFSIGLRAENLFDKSYALDYANAKAIAVSDRKLWLNMEYRF